MPDHDRSVRSGRGSWSVQPSKNGSINTLLDLINIYRLIYFIDNDLPSTFGRRRLGSLTPRPLSLHKSIWVWHYHNYFNNYSIDQEVYIRFGGAAHQPHDLI